MGIKLRNTAYFPFLLEQLNEQLTAALGRGSSCEGARWAAGPRRFPRHPSSPDLLRAGGVFSQVFIDGKHEARLVCFPQMLLRLDRDINEFSFVILEGERIWTIMKCVLLRKHVFSYYYSIGPTNINRNKIVVNVTWKDTKTFLIYLIKLSLESDWRCCRQRSHG